MRTEEEKELVNRGKLWNEFKTTLYGQELYRFFDGQEKLAKDAAFECLVNDHPEEAKQAAQKLSGILAVRSFIDDSISDMNELFLSEREDKKYKKEIPNHV